MSAARWFSAFFTPLSAIPIALVMAAQNQAAPIAASSGRTPPKDGMLKKRAWLAVSRTAAAYTNARDVTAHTNASDIAWPVGRSRAVDMSWSSRVNPPMSAWLRAMNAWNGVEYNEKTRAHTPRSALSTDHTSADIYCDRRGDAILYTDV